MDERIKRGEPGYESPLRGKQKLLPHHIAALIAGRAAKRLSVLDRFWSKVDVRGGGECWEFAGSRTNRNYVHFNISGDPKSGNRIRMLAHRFSWELHNAREIPAGLVIDHICRNTVCVNPAHLRAVTQESNCMELARGNPFYGNREKTECKNGHPFAGDNLARILVKSRNKKRWIATRVCLTCQPHAHGHPRRYWLPGEIAGSEGINQESSVR